MSTEGQKPETPEPEDPTQAVTPADELAIPLDPRLMLRERGLRGYWDVFVRRGQAGGLGAIPGVVGPGIIFVVFQLVDSPFLSAHKPSNPLPENLGGGVVFHGGLVWVVV